MDSYAIYRQAKSLIQKYGTNNPVRLAADMGILVYDVEDLQDLLGMYTCRWKHRIILMNPNINETLYRMVLAHEIGHDQRHRALAAGGGLKEFELFNMTNITEYEANAAGAHILIDEDEMIGLFRDGYDIAAAAGILHVNINLLLIKIQEMNKLGMSLKLPFQPDSRFFQHVKY